MTVSFVRIDDRVLHGQIVTRWSKARPCKGIVIIDNSIAHDKFQRRVYLSAAPEGIPVGIFDEQEGAKRIERAITVQNPYFLICKAPQTLIHLLDLGVDFGDIINVGPMSARADTVTVGRNLSLTSDEISAFSELESRGKRVEFQLIPDNAVTSWAAVEKKAKNILAEKSE